MDERSGFCVGCARTLDEIANWSATNDMVRRQLWKLLPARRALIESQPGEEPVA